MQLRKFKLTTKGADVTYQQKFTPRKKEQDINGEFVCKGNWRPSAVLVGVVDAFRSYINKFVSGDKEYFNDADVSGVVLIENKYEENLSIQLVCKKMLSDDRVFNFTTPAIEVDKLTKKDREALHALIDQLDTEAMAYATKQKREFVQRDLFEEEEESDSDNGEQAEAA